MPLERLIAWQEIERRFVPVTESGCWLWVGRVRPDGYGTFYIADRKSKLAHRLVYEHLMGPIPDRMFLCHKCDTPQCVNPYHMFIGTNKDNQDDMHRKGRWHPARGDAAGKTKIPESDIRRIRKCAIPAKQLAAKYGVNESTIRHIRLRLTWKHVP